MTNRFLLLERSLAGGASPRNGRGPRSGYGRSASKPKSKDKPSCTQFSEMAIDDDQFVLDILQFFFDERLEPNQLNDSLRQVAAQAVWKATQGSKALDFVPRPPKGIPSPKWLVKEAVQIGFRAAQNKCIYENVRIVTKASLIREYQMGTQGDVMAMSLGLGDVSLPTPGSPGTLPGAPNRPTASRSTSDRGIDMIAGFERFAATPYNDAASDCRVGYGHLVHSGPCTEGEAGEFGGGITEQRARELLTQRVRAVEQTVNDVMQIGATQHQFDAIVSFTVNVGETTFASSKVAELLATGRGSQVPEELLKWVNGDGSPIPQLSSRRQAEATLFATGEYPGDHEMTTVQSLGIDLHEFETGPRSVALTDTGGVDWCQIRHDIIRSAVEMQGEWLRSGGLMDESHADALELLVKFWEVGVGMTRERAEAVAALSASDHPTQAFWSAAFISWCVRNAMPDPPPPHDGGFTYHMRHMAYIADAARNRAAADATRPFWLFDINDPAVVPEDGDILCLNRSGTSHSFASVNTNWVTNNPTATATGSSHTDIVIGHFEDGGRRWVETIGGNVGDTVGSRYYSLDAADRLVDQVTLGGATVRNKSNVTQTVGSRAPVVFALIRLTACPDFG